MIFREKISQSKRNKEVSTFFLFIPNTDKNKIGILRYASWYCSAIKNWKPMPPSKIDEFENDFAFSVVCVKLAVISYYGLSERLDMNEDKLKENEKQET